LPRLEQPYFIGSSDLTELLEVIHWLVRLRLGNECLIVDRRFMAALTAKGDAEYARLLMGLPPWVLFFNLAAYDYLPDQRMKGQIEDTKELLQRLGAETAQSLGGVSAKRFLETIREPSTQPYWKIGRAGACQDIFFVTTFTKIPGLVELMTKVTEAAGCPTARLGVYLQPIVQGTNCHCEFSLFHDPTDAAETQAVRTLAIDVIRPLMGAGAFFSRPFGEAARQIMNEDGATVEALKKVKAIVDPAGILNPGKLCF